MSSQKGNAIRTRPQKHKNRSAFKNNLHDTNHRTKIINSTQVSDVCLRCKDIIEWKIKYKKYKPLTQPKTCVKCSLKTVTKAYHVMCRECGRKYDVCTKCCEKKEVVVIPTPKPQYLLDIELKNALAGLPERRRRTFFRYLDKLQKEKDDGDLKNSEEEKIDLMEKLNSLKLQDGDDEDEDNSDDDFNEDDD